MLRVSSPIYPVCPVPAPSPRRAPPPAVPRKIISYMDVNLNLEYGTLVQRASGNKMAVLRRRLHKHRMLDRRSGTHVLFMSLWSIVRPYRLRDRRDINSSGMFTSDDYYPQLDPNCFSVRLYVLRSIIMAVGIQMFHTYHVKTKTAYVRLTAKFSFVFQNDDLSTIG